MKTRKTNPNIVQQYGYEVLTVGVSVDEPFKFMPGRRGRRGVFRDAFEQAVRSNGGVVPVRHDILDPSPIDMILNVVVVEEQL